MQLEFLWKELREQYPTVLNALKSARTVLEASDAVLLGNEKPADQSEKVRIIRAEYGEKFYGKYHGKEICSEGNQNSETEVKKAIGPEKGKMEENDDLDSEQMTDHDGSFQVHVKVKHLNIRTGPGTNFGRVRFIPPGVYTIVEVREGKGSKTGWGG